MNCINDFVYQVFNQIFSEEKSKCVITYNKLEIQFFQLYSFIIKIKICYT